MRRNLAVVVCRYRAQWDGVWGRKMNIDLDSWEAGYADGLCTRVVSLRGWFRPGVVFERLLPGPRMACRVAHEDATVNAGAKMHRLAGAKIHQ